jgi:hypothetical protein
MLLSLSLWLWLSTTHGLINGVCDEDLCVCMVRGSLECPEWMALSSEGGPYDTIGAVTCPQPNRTDATDAGGDGVNSVCTGWMADFFTEYPYSKVPCSIREDGTSQLDYYILWDGNSTTSTPILNYTEPADPIPDCAIDMPFTLAPSMSHTISPAPTPEQTPSSASKDGQGVARALILASSVGIVAQIFLLQ